MCFLSSVVNDILPLLQQITSPTFWATQKEYMEVTGGLVEKVGSGGRGWGSGKMTKIHYHHVKYCQTLYTVATYRIDQSRRVSSGPDLSLLFLLTMVTQHG